MTLAAVAAAPAWVQAQTIPEGTSPGLFAPDLLRDQLREQQRQQAIEERARRIEVPPLQGDEADAEDALPEDSPEFVLQGISFNSSVFLTDDELQALAEPFVGVTITFADLNRLLRAINARYAELGQLTGRAVVPPQSLEDGQLRVALVEAKIDSVVLQGERRVRDDFYRQQIGMAADDILDSPLMIENIRRFNATTPGPQISAGLAPGERFGTTRIDLETFEPDPWSWSVFANNYGSESTGREQLGGTLNWFSPTGVADNLAAVVVATSGSQYFNLRYSRPVTRRNGVAWIEAGRNDLKIKRGPLRDLNIEGESTTVTLGFDQPWWQSARWLWLFGGSYSWQNSESTIESFSLSEIDTQEVTLRAQFEFRD
ncbi:MAG: ShlB/FhaC/HecB family hemolysin secretion/activation protein, partial [Pseudomonadaceae bacterium]